MFKHGPLISASELLETEFLVIKVLAGVLLASDIKLFKTAFVVGVGFYNG